MSATRINRFLRAVTIAVGIAVILPDLVHAVDVTPASLLQEARASISRNDSEKATATFEQILAQFPDSAQARETCGLLPAYYAATNQLDKIESVYLHATTRFPKDTKFLFSLEQALGDLYLARKDYLNSAEYYAVASGRNPECKTAIALCEKTISCHTAAGDMEKAAEVLKDLLVCYSKLADDYATDTANYWYY